jgi:glycosyltransferase involved in cell wall biosynthesis
MTRALGIGFAGGIPPALGGGGMELQMQRTAEALERLGHRVARVEAAPADTRFDVLHAFHSEAWLTQVLPHWKHNRCPLVTSPVLTIRPGLEQRTMRIARRIPVLHTSARQRSDVFRAADAIVALTEHERDLLVSQLGAPAERVRVIPNGVTPIEQAQLPTLPDGVPDGPFALMVGNVSSRKRQAEVLAAAAGRLPFVIVGGFEGSERTRLAWLEAVERYGAVWLGELHDQPSVRALQAAAAALVLVSAAEGQSLALLECLAVGTPAVVSDIPAHRELSERFPEHVHLVGAPAEIGVELDRLRSRPAPPPAGIPTWDDVARELEDLYAGLAGS